MDEHTERIMAALRRDGRASYTRLAAELGLDRNQVARRVGELLANGDLRVVASVHPDILGLQTYAHLAISTRGPLDELLAELGGTDTAVLVTETMGPHQVVADLLVADMAELQQRLRRIRRVPSVVDIAVDVYQEVQSIFFSDDAPDLSSVVLDDTDVQIIGLLRTDGRMPYAEVAAHVGLSVSSCRARVQRLLERHVIRIGAIRQRERMTRDLLCGFGVRVRDDPAEAAQIFRAQPGLEFLATVTGRFDLIATVSFGSLEGRNEFMGRMRALASFVSAEDWLHTRIVHERYDRSLGVFGVGG